MGPVDYTIGGVGAADPYTFQQRAMMQNAGGLAGGAPAGAAPMAAGQPQMAPQGLMGGGPAAPAATASPLLQQSQAALLFKQQELAKAQAAQALAEKEQMKADLQDAYQNPSSEKIAALTAKYPQLSEQYKRTFDMLSESEKQTRLQQSSRAYAALLSGENQVAADGLREDATAYANAGRANDAKALEKMADLVEKHPETARTSLGFFLSSNMGGDFTKAFAELETTPAAVRQKEAEAATKETEALFAVDKQLADIGYTREQADRLKMQSKAEAERLRLDWAEYALKKAKETREALEKAGDVPANVSKEIADNVDGAVAAGAVADSMGALANDIGKVKADTGAVNDFLNTGVTGKLAEKGNAALVSQGPYTAVRRRYQEIREAAIAAELKGQGSVTENERAAFRDGWLDPASDPAVLEQDLRRRAAVLGRSAQVKRGLVDFKTQNRGNGAAARQFTTSDGFIVPKGMTQSEFAKQYAEHLTSSNPPRSSSTATQSDTVQIRLPDGRVGTIPRKNLDAAKAKGAVPIG